MVTQRKPIQQLFQIKNHWKGLTLLTLRQKKSTKLIEILQLYNNHIINCYNLVVLTDVTQHSFESIDSLVMKFVARRLPFTTSITHLKIMAQRLIF